MQFILIVKLSGGANFDETLEDEMIITVIATRFGEKGPGTPD